MLGGRVWAIFCTLPTAAPRETSGAGLNEMVTAGNWPWWLTVSGPTERAIRAIVFSGTNCPEEERT